MVQFRYAPSIEAVRRDTYTQVGARRLRPAQGLSFFFKMLNGPGRLVSFPLISTKQKATRAIKKKKKNHHRQRKRERERQARQVQPSAMLHASTRRKNQEPHARMPNRPPVTVHTALLFFFHWGTKKETKKATAISTDTLLNIYGSIAQRRFRGSRSGPLLYRSPIFHQHPFKCQHLSIALAIHRYKEQRKKKPKKRQSYIYRIKAKTFF